MKINNNYQINFGSNGNKQDNKEQSSTISPKTIDANACDCQSTYNLAMIKSKDNSDILFEKAIALTNRIIAEDEHIGRQNIDKRCGETIIRLQAGKEVEGFKGLYYDNIKIACFFDENGDITNAFKHNKNTQETFVYDKDGNLTHYFSKEDREALFYYKYHPDSIHTKFRKGKNHWGGSFQDETNEMANRLINIFNDENKIFRTTEDKTLYRALQKELTEEQMDALSTIGGVYTDPSFCSTAENLDVAKRFSCGNPILKINVPKGSKYMDIERLFNIDSKHWREKELLLDRNSKFLVTGFDTENNIIEVDYIG